MVDIDDIRAALADIAPAFGISEAYLFGSYARGEQDCESDVDLVIVLDKPLGFKRARLGEELELRLGLPVDLVFGETQLYQPFRAAYERDRVMVYAA